MPPHITLYLGHHSSSSPTCLQLLTALRSYLVEVVEGFVQVCVHPSWGLVGDFDGALQDALGNDVALRGRCRLCANEDAEVLVAALTVLLQLLLQGAQPLGHQVDVLQGWRGQGCISCSPLHQCWAGTKSITPTNSTQQGYAVGLGTCPSTACVQLTAPNVQLNHVHF